ncbi:MAG: multidrug resistance protein family [Acidobacteriaceae bacterium]|jgi:MATE family multidrug resistance protein|nr:multidrug resistance protein family [Acidobacteriaceae bacterium]
MLSRSQATQFTPATRFRSELAALLLLAIPVVLSELGWMAMSIVDTIMVGRLSPAAIGAVGISSAIFYTPALFGIGLLLGLDTLVAQAFGRGDFDDCHRALAQGVYLAIAYTPVAMLLVGFAPHLFPVLGITETVRAPAMEYIQLLNLSALPLLIYVAFRRYLQGVGKVRPVTFALISANLVNWFGNWALIYGKLGLPAMGVRGSALSTCVARVYMAAVLVWWAWKHERERGHPLFAHWPGLRPAQFRRLLVLGWPAASQLLFEVGAFSLATLMAGRLSPDILAAHQIVLNSASLTYMVPLGVSAAAAISVGHAVGAGNRPLARRNGSMAIAIGTVFMALAATAFLTIPQKLIHVYTHDGQTVTVAVRLLAVAAVFQVFDAVQGVGTGALRGLGKTRGPMVINLIAYGIIGLPIGYTLCFKTPLGIYGLWSGLTLALIFAAALVLAMWLKQSKVA